MSASDRPSPPFADRELDGSILLEQLGVFRAAAISPARLLACDRALEGLERMTVRDGVDRVQQVAVSDCGDAPALAQWLLRWGPKLRSPTDLFLFRRHVRRLCFLGALMPALWQAAGQISPGRAP